MENLSNFVKKRKDKQEEYENTFCEFLKEYEEFKDESIKDNERALNFEERIMKNEKNYDSLRNKIEDVITKHDQSESVNCETSHVNDDLACNEDKKEVINQNFPLPIPTM